MKQISPPGNYETGSNNQPMKEKLLWEILAPYMAEGERIDKRGRFSDMPLSVLQRLIDLGFVEMGEWNSCLGVEDMFLPFLRRNPLFTAHGYVGIPEENGKDGRVIVEGVERNGLLSKKEILDFCIEFMGSADDTCVEENYAFCWHD